MGGNLLLGMKYSLKRIKKQLFLLGVVHSVAVLHNIHSIKLKAGNIACTSKRSFLASSFEGIGTEEIVERSFCQFTLLPEWTVELPILVLVVLVCCLDRM